MKLADATKTSHQKCINAVFWKPESPEDAKARRAAKRVGLTLERRPEGFASKSVVALGKPEFRDFHNYLKRERGIGMAHAVMRTLSAALTWGTENSRWRIPKNLIIEMEFEQPAGRIAQVTMPEFASLDAAALEIERPSIGDCIFLGLFTGQRQTDRLRMKDEGDVDGRHAFRQNKTGALIDIKEAPQLSDRLDAARARVAKLTLSRGLKYRPDEIVINETTCAPYTDKTYGNWFLKVRTLAAFGALNRMMPAEGLARAEDLNRKLRSYWLAVEDRYPISEEDKQTVRQRALSDRTRALNEWLTNRADIDSNGNPDAWRLAPCPSLLFVNARGELDAKHDQDLRDTCVMLLDRAMLAQGKEDLLTICDITGHSYSSVQTIVKHYRARNAQRADYGIDLLVLQVRKEGMKG